MDGWWDSCGRAHVLLYACDRDDGCHCMWLGNELRGWSGLLAATCDKPTAASACCRSPAWVVAIWGMLGAIACKRTTCWPSHLVSLEPATHCQPAHASGQQVSSPRSCSQASRGSRVSHPRQTFPFTSQHVHRDVIREVTSACPLCRSGRVLVSEAETDDCFSDLHSLAARGCVDPRLSISSSAMLIPRFSILDSPRSSSH